ncbi:MAG: peptidoglycan DD-metalloendopeptidase family protein [Hyphomonas sp.]|nr:peptidoglycan DD-metalloendopeptidase family protein [Hyphomonas sp.]
MSIIGLVLLAVLWSGVVWAAAALICRMQPSPKAAQAIWRGAALMMVAPFAASLIVPSLPRMAGEALPALPMLDPVFVAPAGAVAAPAAATFRLPEPAVIVLCILIAGWAVRAALWIVSQVRLQRIKQYAFGSSNSVRHWAEAVGLRHTPRVRFHRGGQAFLAGLFRRTIYVPARLAFDEDAYHVVVHEMVHLKRGDLVLRPLERFVADVFWFSPFCWWMRSQLDYWREVVVDEETAELVGDRIAYARTLTSAARLSRLEAVLPVAAFTLKKEGTLKMRLNELLSEPARRPKRLGLAIAAALALATPLALAQGMAIKGTAASSGAAYSHAVLDKAKITSSFGLRKHPTTGEFKEHTGVDLALKEGVPVYAPADGEVTKSAFDDGYGNFVEMTAGDTTLRFAQLKKTKVKAGDAVAAGEVIGLMGQTGKYATGPHLHLEVWRDGKAVDPQTEEGLVLASQLVEPPRAPRVPKPPRAGDATEPVAPAPPKQPTDVEAEIPEADPIGYLEFPEAVPAPPAPQSASAPADGCKDTDRRTAESILSDVRLEPVKADSGRSLRAAPPLYPRMHCIEA